MPAIPSVLASLIQSEINKEVKTISSNGRGPLEQQNPSYFTAMCTALGRGIAVGSPMIQFTTVDTGASGAPPVPGIGTGVGIVVDADFMEKEIYNTIRQYTVQDFGKTTHDPHPPALDNSGIYLQAICKGIASAVKQHYTTAWMLTSSHSIVYIGSGQILKGHFSGLQSELVKSQIVSQGPTLKGKFWPRMAQAIAEAYVKTIETQSTGQVTIAGICVPSLAQICGLPMSGTGTGVAA